jgi:hypothetical protein
LLSLDISDNRLLAEGTKLLAEVLKGNQIMTALNISSNTMTYDGGDKYGGKSGDMSGVAALADVIPGMRALAKLDISNNDIGQGGSLQLIIEVCDTKGIELLDNHESESDNDY